MQFTYVNYDTVQRRETGEGRVLQHRSRICVKHVRVPHTPFP